jgi:hypothetical protein
MRLHDVMLTEAQGLNLTRSISTIGIISVVVVHTSEVRVTLVKLLLDCLYILCSINEDFPNVG